MAYRLVVGLGNPGREYDQTRHNVGFAVLDLVAARVGSGGFHSESRGPVDLLRVGEARLVKPLTYMNRSGEAVRLWLDWLKLEPIDLLVVVDDASLPLGQLRFREQGSHGGHNGLRSIEEQMGSNAYARLRCGVGPVPVSQNLEKFVLERFGEEEKEKVKSMTADAATAYECCQQQGIAVAMQLFNSKQSCKNEEKT